MHNLAGQGEVAPLVSAEGLHMSDLGFDCLAEAMAKVIDDAAKAPGSLTARR